MKSLSRQDDREELLMRLARLTNASPRRWGKMSAPQMVSHLIDAFQMMAGERSVSDVSTFFSRTLIKNIALYAPSSWPQGIQTVPEVDQEIGGRKPVEFAADVAQVVVLIDKVTRNMTGIDGRRHPIFGRLSLNAWMRWAYLHTDHHLRQFGV